MDEIEFVDRVWAAGWSYEMANALAELVGGYGIGVGQVTPESMRLVLGGAAKNRRKAIGRRHAAQMVIRRRRAYNHDLALRLRHEREVLRPPFEGLRCHGCKHIPPQPGEVMEEDWKAGLFKEEEGRADLTGA